MIVIDAQMKILPGTPNDANRDYLPEAIVGSDMVVNENGNNSIVYPERLRRHTAVLVDGVEDVWYEYVPASYDGTKPVPLVLSMHGGLMTGWGQAVYTSWTLVADREGLIVLFPDANKRRFWLVEYDKVNHSQATKPNPEGVYLNPPPDNPDDNHDMNCMLALIEHAKTRYNIDAGRVFMQGMSMGNMMTSQFARYHGQALAGQAGSAGPTALPLLFDEQDQIINRGGPLAVWQSRMELDKVPTTHFAGADTVVARNREYWLRINGCDPLPEISIQGEDNLAFYHGGKAPVVFRDVRNRDHGQTLDDAELAWDYLFSGVRRDASGVITLAETRKPRKGDAFAIAIAQGKAKALVHGQLCALQQPVFMHNKLKYHGLKGDAWVRGTYFMMPAMMVAKALHATCEQADDGLSVTLTFANGDKAQFARGSIGCVWNNEVYSMFCEAVWREGELCLPVEWIAKRICNLQTSVSQGVLYITDHYAELSQNMAELIRDELLS